MPDLPLDQIIATLQSGGWPALLSLLVYVLVRYSKPDVVFPSLPAQFRPLLALVAGPALSTAEAVIAGTPWQAAVDLGLKASVTAIVAHVIGIEWIRGGRELPMPGIRKPPSDPGSGTTTRIVGGIGLVLLVLLLPGCAALRSANDARLALCDAIGEERQEAEAQRLGVSPVEWLALWKATCLIRMQQAEGEAVGAVGSAQ